MPNKITNTSILIIIICLVDRYLKKSLKVTTISISIIIQSEY